MKILKEKKRKYVIAWYFYLGNIKYIFIQGKIFKYNKKSIRKISYYQFFISTETYISDF